MGDNKSKKQSKGYFKGYYFKHQKAGQTVALIPGVSDDGAFIQVITNEGSDNIKCPSISLKGNITVGNSIFSEWGIKVNERGLRGHIAYEELTPLKSDIMGPFRFLPMECRHGVVSMYHKLRGGIKVNGRYYDLDGGVGYIEMDSGRSFPKEYLWLHCNDFREKSSIMLSVAAVPFMGFNFNGCICAVIHNGKEYRFSTYNGVSVIAATREKVALSCGRYRLEVNINSRDSSPLYSPIEGRMDGIIHESNNTSARFILYEGNTTVFDLQSDNVSFEYNMKDTAEQG